MPTVAGTVSAFDKDKAADAYGKLERDALPLVERPRSLLLGFAAGWARAARGVPFPLDIVAAALVAGWAEVLVTARATRPPLLMGIGEAIRDRLSLLPDRDSEHHPSMAGGGDARAAR